VLERLGTTESTTLPLKHENGGKIAWLDYRLETAFAPYFEGAHWAVPASSELVEAASNG
jgi:hypothetical protein